LLVFLHPLAILYSLFFILHSAILLSHEPLDRVAVPSDVALLRLLRSPRSAPRAPDRLGAEGLRGEGWHPRGRRHADPDDQPGGRRGIDLQAAAVHRRGPPRLALQRGALGAAHQDRSLGGRGGEARAPGRQGPRNPDLRRPEGRLGEGRQPLPGAGGPAGAAQRNHVLAEHLPQARIDPTFLSGFRQEPPVPASSLRAPAWHASCITLLHEDARNEDDGDDDRKFPFPLPDPGGIAWS